jgi:hypothetical protein
LIAVAGKQSQDRVSHHNHNRLLQGLVCIHEQAKN